GTSCVDTQTDRANCGACGHRCGGFCSAGSCVDPVQLSSGANHVCARMSDGTVRCWGRSHNGQIGNGVLADAPRPVAVTGLAGVVDIAARSNGGDTTARSCAVLNSGAIQCWGDNLSGSFGDGTTTSQNHPATLAVGLSSASQIALGGAHSCAITGND